MATSCERPIEPLAVEKVDILNQEFVYESCMVIASRLDSTKRQSEYLRLQSTNLKYAPCREPWTVVWRVIFYDHNYGPTNLSSLI